MVVIYRSVYSPINKALIGFYHFTRYSFIWKKNLLFLCHNHYCYMKRIVRYLFILVVLFSTVTPASAGFWVKAASHASATTAASATSVSSVLQHSKAAEIIRPAANVFSPKYYQRSYRQSEWVSIAAFVCGMVGLLVPGVNFLAMLFGVLAMGRGGNVKGLAIAGFILGLLELILFLITMSTFGSLILL